MSYLSNSRQPNPRPTFEIQRTDCDVQIITRDPYTNEVTQVVSFSGQRTAADRSVGSHRLVEPIASARRW